MANPYETTSDPFKERVAVREEPQLPSLEQPPPAAEQRALTAESKLSPTQEGVQGGAATDAIDDRAPPDFFYDTERTSTGWQAPQDAPVSATGTSTRPASGTMRVWSVEFYQQFFDVNTTQVLLRLSSTLFPLAPPDFLAGRKWHASEAISTQPELGQAGVGSDALDGASVAAPEPDLYGPLWVCTTLWITVGIVSNLNGWFAYTNCASCEGKFVYDFTAVSASCIVSYCYCFLFGAMVWAVMKWKGLPASLVDTVCVYGYSLFVLELVSILCVVPSNRAKFAISLVGGLWSTAYLLVNFWRMWQLSLERRWFIGIVAVVSLAHMALALTLGLYFLRYRQLTN